MVPERGRCFLHQSAVVGIVILKSFHGIKSNSFRKKLLSYSEITMMLFRTLPVAPAATKSQKMKKLLAVAISVFENCYTLAGMARPNLTVTALGVLIW
jgi:hypothetical protein